MGAVTGKYSKVYSYIPSLKQYEVEFEALNISEAYVGKFYKCFDDAKINNCEKVEVTKLLQQCNIENCGYATRALSYYDNKKLNYEINFRNFVFCIWNYCTLNKAGLVDFIFDLYDEDDSGDIDPTEAQKLLTDIYGEGFTKCYEILKAYNKFAMMINRQINLEVFRQFIQENITILEIPMEIQRKLRMKVFGTRYWMQQEKYRIDKYGKTYHPVRLAVKSAKKRRHSDGFMLPSSTPKTKPSSSMFGPDERGNDSQPTVPAHTSTTKVHPSPGPTRPPNSAHAVLQAGSQRIKPANSSSSVGAPSMPNEYDLDRFIVPDRVPYVSCVCIVSVYGCVTMNYSVAQAPQGSPKSREVNHTSPSTRERASSATKKNVTDSGTSSSGGGGLTLQNVALLRAQSDKISIEDRIKGKVEVAGINTLNSSAPSPVPLTQRRHSLSFRGRVPEGGNTNVGRRKSLSHKMTL